MEAAAEPGNLAGVRHIVLVLSGKGGVGKSTISTELALALRHAGKKVGILDVDLCGPSVPRMLRVQGRAVHQGDSGWVPVFVDREQSISLMSMGFLLEQPDEAVVWRGPKKNALIKQFVSDVAWGQLDYLVVDTPPGTSDEHMAVVDALRPYSPLGALVVTTPQAVSVGDVRRELTFCRKVGLRVIGLVENMSGFVCPHCSVSPGWSWVWAASTTPRQGPAHCGQRGWRWTRCLCVPGVHQHLLQGRRRGAGETCWRPLPGLGAPGPRAHAEPGGWPGLHPGLSRQPRLPRALLHRPEDSQPDARGALLTEAG